VSLSFVHLNVEHWATSEPDRSEIRRRFVHATALALLDHGLDIVAHGLDVQHDVAPGSGRSARTFHDTYRTRGSVTARRRLVEDLVAEVCLPTRTSRVTEMGLQLVDVIAPAAAGAPRDAFLDVVRHYANDQFHEALIDDISRLQALAWALGQHDESVRAAFVALYDDWMSKVTPGIDAVIEGIGRRLRPPWTADLVATTLIAAIEGLMTRVRIDPDAVPDGLFGEFVVGMIDGFTEPDEAPTARASH
jgi:BetI-type transcriptional repressor, C-terminal